MNDRFSKLHPVFHTVFFILVFVLMLSVNSPAFSIISLICGLLYGAKIRGKEILKTTLFMMLVIAIVGVFNMLFAHYGVTELFTINDTRFTLESLLYGFNQGVVFCSIMLWFGAFSRVMDSERVVYVLRFAPKLALIFSMVLGFIPRFTKKLEDIKDAQLGLNGGNPPKKRLHQALDNYSALVTYSLESSIITADSMSARGYDPHKIRAGRYKYSAFDIFMIILIVTLGTVVIVEKAIGNISFYFDPVIYNESTSILGTISYSLLLLLPLVVDLWEDMLWKLSNAKS